MLHVDPCRLIPKPAQQQAQGKDEWYLGRAGAVQTKVKKVEEGEGGGGKQKKRRGRRGGEESEEEGSPAARAVWPLRGKVR